jgi:hypothetical protein
MTNIPSRILLASLPLVFTLAGCVGSTFALQSAPPTVQSAGIATAEHAREILYVLVNAGTDNSYIALYDAYAKHPHVLSKITQGLANPGAIWVDAKGNLYAGNDMTYTSAVVEYAPGAIKPTRIYTNGIDLPFGGMVDPTGTMYVSVVSSPGRTEGGIAIFPRRKMKPSSYLTDNVYVPHGIAEDANGNIFVSVIWGDQSSVVEFPAGSSYSTVLPLNDLNSGAFLEDLKFDAKSDIVVADAKLNAVRFYPPPYGNESQALTDGLSAPTALAYRSDGALFVGNEYVNARNGNVVIFPPGATKPLETITDGITAGVIGVAVGPGR